MTSFCQLFLLLPVSPHIHGILVAYLMNSNSGIAKGLDFDIFHVYCVLFQDVKGKVFTCTNCNFSVVDCTFGEGGGFVCPVLLINVTLIIYLICILTATSFMEKSFYLHLFLRECISESLLKF